MNSLSASNLRTSFLACALAMVASASALTASAQTQLRVNVPFAFQNGSQRLPAGTYSVDLQSEHMMVLRGASTSGFVMTDPDYNLQAPDKGKMVFQHIGSRYFLREVWAPGSTTIHQCIPSRAEKRAETAQGPVAPSQVELALLSSAR